MNPMSHKKWGIAAVIILACAVGLLIPWAFHIGGRPTALYWSGTGTLVTKTGPYPLYVLFYPTMHISNGVDGWGFLCTSRNTVVPLSLSGKFDGGPWRWSLDTASIEIRLFKPLSARQTLFHPGDTGGFDLVGHWHGHELEMNENGEHSTPFPSGFKVEDASVVLQWGNKSDFNAACSKVVALGSTNTKDMQ